MPICARVAGEISTPPAASFAAARSRPKRAHPFPFSVSLQSRYKGRMDRIGFQQRAAAFLIDLGVVMIAAHLIVLVDVLLNESGSYNFFGVISAGGSALLVLSYGLMEIFSAGTLGKRIMGLTIAMDDGAPAPRGRLMRRWAIKQSPLFFGALATLLFILSDPGGPAKFAGYVREGLLVFAWIDAVIALVLLIFVLIGCLRVR